MLPHCTYCSPGPGVPLLPTGARLHGLPGLARPRPGPRPLLARPQAPAQAGLLAPALGLLLAGGGGGGVPVRGAVAERVPGAAPQDQTHQESSIRSRGLLRLNR